MVGDNWFFRFSLRSRPRVKATRPEKAARFYRRGATGRQPHALDLRVGGAVAGTRRRAKQRAASGLAAARFYRRVADGTEIAAVRK